MTPLVLQRLRQATHESHQSLEQTLDIISWLRSPGRRRLLVARFHQLYQTAEAVLRPWLSGMAGLEFDQRARTTFLARDLVALGATSIAAPPADTPRIDGAPAALGLFYVLEGSTLGGRMIDKQLVGEGISREGLSFLNPYGAETSARWRGFVEVMEREAKTLGDIDAVVAAAVEGFAWMQANLCAPEDALSAA